LFFIAPPRYGLSLEVIQLIPRVVKAHWPKVLYLLQELSREGGFTLMIYQEQLQELIKIQRRSQKADDDDFYNTLLQELRQLSNSWHNLKKNNELSFPEYTQLIEKKYYLSETLQLRKCN
jgi:hypothetical protein